MAHANYFNTRLPVYTRISMRISRKNRRFDELLDSFFFFNVKYTIDRGEIYEKFVLDS